MKITIETGPEEGGPSGPLTVSGAAPQPTPTPWLTTEGQPSTTAVTVAFPTHDAGRAPALETLSTLETLPSVESLPPSIMGVPGVSTVTQADAPAGPGPLAMGD